MWDSQKRPVDQDPDYESIPLHAQQKRIKLHEQDAKEATVRKIEQIVKSRFSEEISARESELDTINQRIYQAQVLLEKLRVGIITKYYAVSGQPTSNEPVLWKSIVSSCLAGMDSAMAANEYHLLPVVAKSRCTHRYKKGSAENQQTAQVHPTSRKYLGKTLPPSDFGNAVTAAPSNLDGAKAAALSADEARPASNCAREKEEEATAAGRAPRLKNKMRVIVGNVSKYISSEKRDPTDHATHKWMVYVRCPPGEPEIASVVRKVRFFLHPSYRPNDLVEVTEAPFQLVRKGWGEFPLRVQLHFRERWNKPVDVIHSLKLDKTYTGLQTLGAETVVDLWLCPMNGRQPEEAPERPLGSATNGEASCEKTETLPHSVKETCGARVQRTSEESSEDSQPQQSSLGGSQPVQDTTCATGEQQQQHLQEQESSESGADAAPLNTVSREVFVGQLVEPGPPTTAQNAPSASLARNPSVTNGTSVNAKPSLQTVMSANGVAAQSFVKCTDSLGRVLLIPTRSLLRPVAAVAPQPIVSGATATVKASSVLKSGAKVVSSKAVPHATGAGAIVLSQNLAPAVTGVGTVVAASSKPVCTTTGATVVRLAPNITGTAFTKTTLNVVPTVTGTAVTEAIAKAVPNATGPTTVRTASNVAASAGSTPVVAPAACSVGSPTYTLLVLPGATSARNQIVLVPSNSPVPKEPAAACSVQQAAREVPRNVPQTAIVRTELPAQPRVDADVANAVKALQAKLSSLRLNNFPDLKQAIFAVASLFPLIGVTHAEKMACFPYAALDGDTYFSWPEAKQRASEWLRASEVRKTLKALIEKQAPSWHSSQQSLSRKKVMILCRRFGFTPLHSDVDCQANNMQFLRSTCCSYSEPRELVSSLAALETVPRPSVEEEVVDVEECDRPAVARKKDSAPKDGTTSRAHLPLSPCASYVREAASEVGVYLGAAEPCIDVPVVEEMILSACKNFATCLLRNAVNMAFERSGSERSIASVGVEDVYNGIRSLKECDLLTNEGLGIELTRETIVDSSHL